MGKKGEEGEGGGRREGERTGMIEGRRGLRKKRRGGDWMGRKGEREDRDEEEEGRGGEKGRGQG